MAVGLMSRHRGPPAGSKACRDQRYGRAACWRGWQTWFSGAWLKVEGLGWVDTTWPLQAMVGSHQVTLPSDLRDCLVSLEWAERMDDALSRPMHWLKMEGCPRNLGFGA